MNASTIEILNNECVKILDIECCVCYEKFIDIDTFDLLDLYKKLKTENKYPIKLLEEMNDSTSMLSYNDRFECITCRNTVCYGCFVEMIDETDEEMDNWKGEKDTMDITRVITCPICKTIDYRLKIIGIMGDRYGGARGGNLPEDLLRNIKKLKNKNKIEII